MKYLHKLRRKIIVWRYNTDWNKFIRNMQRNDRRYNIKMNAL